MFGFRYQPGQDSFDLSPEHFQKLAGFQPLKREQNPLVGQTFTFLNRTQEFPNGVDWNFNVHGKLWTYNLNYFEFLLQPDMSQADGLALVKDYIQKESSINDGMEPYPTSLRLIYWIQFLLLHRINDPMINGSIHRQLRHLEKNLEYHLMGNHLLENAIALVFGGVFLNEQRFIQRSLQLLDQELNEQILSDGAHFELTPSYHLIIMVRLLDTIQIMSLTEHRNEHFSRYQRYASKMLGWLHQIAFSNRDLPHVNDSTPQDLSLSDCQTYAERLGISTSHIPLKDSGYRMFRLSQFELFCDVGEMGPTYQPGHAHCDTLQFLMHVRNQPFIVDPGISTYEKNARRLLERSTRSHNTVMIGDQEQSQIWGGFRLGRRARIIRIDESPNNLLAIHDGYKNLGVRHSRSFHWKDSSVTIIDDLGQDIVACAFLHFHPEVHIKIEEGNLECTNCTIRFEDATQVDLDTYQYSDSFHSTTQAQKAIIYFNRHLITQITIHENSFPY